MIRTSASRGPNTPVRFSCRRTLQAKRRMPRASCESRFPTSASGPEFSEKCSILSEPIPVQIPASLPLLRRKLQNALYPSPQVTAAAELEGEALNKVNPKILEGMRPCPRGHPALRIHGAQRADVVLTWQTRRYAADALRKSNIGDFHATTHFWILGEIAKSRNRGIAKSRNRQIAESRNRGIA